MYLSFYNLSAKPFQINTDPRFLWLGRNHQEALANLKYGLLDNNGFVVLIGDVGTGKTTLVNALVSNLDHRVRVVGLNHPSLAIADFFSFVLRSFDPSAVGTSKAECLHYLRGHLRSARAEGKIVLLVIDEAHRLSDTLLEEIRLLSNMELDGAKLINIIFVGQPELKRKLQSYHCRAIRQRVTLFYYLQPLSRADIGEYVAHRLKVAGADAGLFTPAALQAIHKYSRGYPRMINKICDRALLAGFAKNQRSIDCAIVRECAREISQIDPVFSAMPVTQRLSIHGKDLVSALKRIWTSGKKPGRSTAAAGRTWVGIVRNLRPKLLAAFTTAAALLIGGLLVADHLAREGRSVEMHAAGRTAGPSKEPVAAVDVALRSPEKNAGGGKTGSHSKPPSAASPALVAVPQTAQALPGPAPSPLATAAALMAKKDYAAVIALLETSGGHALQDAESRGLLARALVGRARQLMERSSKEAEGLLRKAVLVDPRNIDALVQLGGLYTRTKMYSDAIVTYHKALALDPQHTEVLFNLGFILASTGMYESAEEMLKRVVQLKPDYVDKALFNLAVVQQKIGKRKESLAALEAAVAIRPENEKALAYLNELRSIQKEH